MSQPSVSRARLPSEYGARGGATDQPLPWDDVDRRLREAPHYWVTSVDTRRRPHARPVDGVWVHRTLCFGGSSQARWVHNLRTNPHISVHLPSTEEVVILDGLVELVTDPASPLAAPSDAATREKYPQYFTDDEPSGFEPFWAFRPSVVFGWRTEGFPNRATRWTFD